MLIPNRLHQLRRGLRHTLIFILLIVGTANELWSFVPAPMLQDSSDLPMQAQNLYDQARVLRFDQEFEEADHHFAEAQELFRQTEDWNMFMVCAIYRCQINYDHLMRPDLLEMITREAQQVLDRQELKDEHFRQERIYYFRALYLENTAQYQLAANTLEQATAILQDLDELIGLDSSYLSSHKALAGSIYYERRDFEMAVSQYQAALAWFPISRPNEEKLLIINNNIGLAMIEMGRIDEGMSYLNKSLAILPKLDPEQYYQDYLQTYFNLIRGYLLQKDPVNATNYLELADQILKSNPGDRHIWHSLSAQLDEQQGRRTNALSHYQTALVQRKNIRGAQHPSVAKLYLSMGQIARGLNLDQEALHYFQNGLRVFDPQLDSDQYFDIPDIQGVNDYYLLIQLLNHRGSSLKTLYPDDGNRILPTYRVAIRAIDSLRLLYESDASKLLLSREAKSVFASALELIYPLYQATGDPVLLEEAFLYMEKSKALLLLENIRKWRDIRLRNLGNKQSNDRFNTWLEQEKNAKLDVILLRRQIEDLRKREDPDAAEQLVVLDRELQKVNNQYQMIKTVLLDSFPQYYEASYEQAVASLAQLKQTLLHNDNSQLVTYFIFNEQSFSMLVSRDTVILKKLAPQEYWNKDFQHYQQALRAQVEDLARAEMYRSYLESAGRLYDVLLRDLLSATPLSQRRLYLVPDDILGFLAFEALLTSHPQEGPISYAVDKLDYLIEEAALSYGYSATLLLESINKPGGHEDQEDYGGFAPVFRSGIPGRAISRDCTTGSMMYLPYSEKSVQATHEMLGGRIFLNEQASLENFKVAAEKYRILQLATHACIDERDALFNVIYFHDTTLATYEIFDIPVRAELVILSACETGNGDLLQGEGIMSLSRGFYYAGSANIVTSLWPADDFATQSLMVLFNGYLKAGWPKDQALQKAKLDYLNSTELREMNAAPAFWATFILIGNQEEVDLDTHSGTFWQWLLLPFLGLSLLFSLRYVLARRRQ